MEIENLWWERITYGERDSRRVLRETRETQGKTRRETRETRMEEMDQMRVHVEFECELKETKSHKVKK